MGKFDVIKGKVKEPYLICVYGVNGVGKSSFGAEAPRSVFIDVEDGTGRLNVDRYPVPTTYNIFGEMLTELAKDKKVETINIDTADHLEVLMVKAICNQYEVATLGDIPHGKGWDLLKKEWQKLFDELGAIRKIKNVILFAHSEIKIHEDPQAPAYSRHQLKLSKGAISVIKDKCDAVLFFNYKTIVNTDSKTKKTKAFGGTDRAMYTEYRATHDGKNRFGLPYEIDMPVTGMWATFEAAVAAGDPESQDAIESTIVGLLSKLSDELLKGNASEQFAKAKEAKDIRKLIAIKNRLLQVTQE